MQLTKKMFEISLGWSLVYQNLDFRENKDNAKHSFV